MATEYPKTSMPGEGLETFALEVARQSQGSVTVDRTFEGDDRNACSHIAAAIRDGTLAGGDAFCGALGDCDPAFLLSSLPFLTTSVDDTYQLASLAREAYGNALQKQGQQLLYMSPWPPSGLWSRNPIHTLEDLRALIVRTYDETSAAVLRATGASALHLSFGEALSRLKEGTVSAVLSSGDGGAGRKLWDHLPHFTAIGYAMPLSFAAVGTRAWNALSPSQQHAVAIAAQVTEDRQWARLKTRLAENTRRMRANGVKINGAPTAEVQRALRDAGSTAIAHWRTQVEGPWLALLDTWLCTRASAR
ncbi:TRAP transporter substrate-binding protein [Ralstonia soli]|uniref:TRAP transporter substrate-binding protein n=1 Tax=Ralstonia soli TaxID=2953896 RepID=A0ABT1AE23_9RALS|nr:TRAP transporter substrate-binding protein [Ralstonia soli]MCO5396640.1 TRAP transporter substrate-binding protein [Ralstonia soli]